MKMDKFASHSQGQSAGSDGMAGFSRNRARSSRSLRGKAQRGGAENDGGSRRMMTRWGASTGVDESSAVSVTDTLRPARFWEFHGTRNAKGRSSSLNPRVSGFRTGLPLRSSAFLRASALISSPQASIPLSCFADALETLMGGAGLGQAHAIPEEPRSSLRYDEEC